MIQSRAQFGYLGASVPLVVVMVMYIGFFAVGAVLNRQALADWLHINPDLGIVIANVAAAVLAIYGYRMLHGVVGAMAVVGGVMFAFLAVQLIRNNDVGSALTWGHFSVGPFLLAMSVAATWQLTFAPYVADYSRYLPANTKISSSFWTTYAGTVLASSWMFAFGAIAVAVAGNAFNGGSIEFIVRQGAFAPGLFFLLLIVGNTGGNAFNVYGLFMSATTTVSAFRPFRVTVTLRTLIITAGAAIGTGVAIAGRGNFIGNFTNFIVLLTYFLIPWTSINLVDFYLVRRRGLLPADAPVPGPPRRGRAVYDGRPGGYSSSSRIRIAVMTSADAHSPAIAGSRATDAAMRSR
jgi:NCS1 family nucleobase:cation symporter-1